LTSPNLPYLTSDFPGIGGRLKQRPEDFFVQEIPLYEPSGSGEHVYAEIEKVGLTTFAAIDRIAQALDVPVQSIGFAGQKDAAAVTRQIISIAGADEQRVAGLQVPGISIRWVARHGNKIRLGHLAGNRFAIKIRDVDPSAVVRLAPVMDRLCKQGMPNYFGEQRFGRRGDNDKLGAALLRADNMALLTQLLGNPDPSVDDAQAIGARKAFDRRDNERALHLFPRHSGLERRVLSRLIKTGRPSAAIFAIDQKLRRLWVSALQSRLFNEVLAKRINSMDRLIAGDLAMKHENGACFLVPDAAAAAAEQPRCDAFEISPTGPLLGYRMTMPQAEALEIESAVFAAASLTPADIRESRQKVKGARRALRVQPSDTHLASGVDEHGPHITVAFTLPAGSYATVLMRELMKTPEADGDAAASAEVPQEAGAQEQENPDEAAAAD
jgi:tRNA pseudouridine13 synthase